MPAACQQKGINKKTQMRFAHAVKCPETSSSSFSLAAFDTIFIFFYSFALGNERENDM
jgi:hypothetical protein